MSVTNSSMNTMPQAPIMNQLLSSLRNQNGSLKVADNVVQASEQLLNSIAIIVPNSQIHCHQTKNFLTKLFNAASYGPINGTYTNQDQQVEEEVNWLVISWTDAETLAENWEKVQYFAIYLQIALKQECIGVIKNGTLVLVRSWS